MLTFLSGTFSDHYSGSSYRGNSRCGWIINPLGNNSSPISLVFTKFQLADNVEVFDSNWPNPSKRLARFSGNREYLKSIDEKIL